jgi:hypothetical protein
MPGWGRGGGFREGGGSRISWLQFVQKAFCPYYEWIAVVTIHMSVHPSVRTHFVLVRAFVCPRLSVYEEQPSLSVVNLIVGEFPFYTNENLSLDTTLFTWLIKKLKNLKGGCRGWGEGWGGQQLRKLDQLSFQRHLRPNLSVTVTGLVVSDGGEEETGSD